MSRDDSLESPGTFATATPSERNGESMKAETPAKACNPVPLEKILTSAVVLNWDALAPGSTTGIVKVEYHIGMDGAVESLKLWASAREYWSLVCDYSTHLGWSDGPRFSNGYHSHRLGRLLQSIMLNQNLFRHDCSSNSNATLEVGTPTAEGIASATIQLSEAFPPPLPRRESASSRSAAAVEATTEQAPPAV